MLRSDGGRDTAGLHFFFRKFSGGAAKDFKSAVCHYVATLEGWSSQDQRTIKYELRHAVPRSRKEIQLKRDAGFDLVVLYPSEGTQASDAHAFMHWLTDEAIRLSSMSDSRLAPVEE